ncbi:hypothetical protein BCR34DRAFT_329797 [Clohesyomyces aquaticus]|uniref:SWIM-type domain-containing protein n=1 Tax=Clohesyomyces aquaticus TaxID=1231657 RepID=A0A1Y1ZLX8_9PLEO|nr:hypothetical protein BCR34DRAFT_329797 [Clohesyomyces aquaticus]
MSAEAFSKLTIGKTMVTTRAAARARTAPPPQRSTSSSISSSSSSAEDVECQSASGITYDIAGLSHEVRKRARHGLLSQNDDIKVKYCKTIPEDPKSYMFYIADDISLRMGERYDAPKCSCGANVGGNACKHIFWMLDQLVKAEAPESFKSQTLRLAADGSTVKDTHPTNIIDSKGLKEIAEDLDWTFQDDRTVEEIEEEVREDMATLLSVFDPAGELPDDFRNPESSILSEPSRKYREVQEFLTELAIDDPRLLRGLRDIIDPTFQAHVFFDKINDRTSRAFRALDEYPANPDSTVERYDVATCADKLKDLVTRVEEYYGEQKGDEPGSRDIAIRAAESLIIILHGVVSRNFNAYEDITTRIVPEDPSENNLFFCLIGGVSDALPQDEATANRDRFVLDALRAFPQGDILRNHWEMLRTIGEKLDDDNAPFKAPPSFMSAFLSITSESRKRTNPEPGGSSAKRPMK